MTVIVSLSEKVKFIEAVFGTGRLARNGRNFDVRCPICAPGDKQKRKLAILLEDDRSHCWTCGYKAHTLAPLVRKFGTREQLIEYRDRFMPVSEHARRCLVIDVTEPERLRLPDDFRLIVTSSTRDPDALALRRYLSQRNVSDRDMWYFKLGYSDDLRWKRRVIVPSFDAAGELNYFVARAIDRARKPKYDNPDANKLPIIFNELNVDWTKELVICEGAFDLMKCPDNAVPLLGSDLNEEGALFNAILAHSTSVVLALDGDMQVKKVPRLARKLAGYDIDVRIARLPPDADPGMTSKQEMKRLINEARPFSWTDAFMDRLDQASQLSLSR